YTVAKGDSQTVATQMKTNSTVGAATPDTFKTTQGFYSLKVTLTDIESGMSAFLLFFGQLQGSFSKENANVTNKFFSPTSQSVGIGNNYYTVTMNAYTPPGPPGQNNFGGIGAQVQVRKGKDVIPTPASVPEPGTLTLAGLGLGLGGLLAWRRRRRAAG